VNGILINSGWEYWDATTYAEIARKVTSAGADSAIDGILLRVNSPGGEVTSAFETADLIIAAGVQKPVWAAIDMIAYSAGYLIASSAEKIYAPPKTGGAGSIGVYSLHLDFSGMLAQDGVKATFIEGPEGKTGGHPFKPLSSKARENMQASVDYMGGLFFGHVSARRGLDIGTIRKMGARMYEGGAAALGAGLVDRIGTIEVALVELRAELNRQRDKKLQYPAASAAKSRLKEGVRMEAPEAEVKAASDIPNPAAASTAPVPPVPSPETAPVAGVGDAEEIVALCAIAGKSASVAHDFITRKISAKDVSAALIAARASEASQTEIISQVQPQSGASAGPNANESPIVKAAERLAHEEKERK
jgi:signal peptide peptidase SppA